MITKQHSVENQEILLLLIVQNHIYSTLLRPFNQLLLLFCSILFCFNLWISSIVVAVCCFLGLIPYGLLKIPPFIKSSVITNFWIYRVLISVFPLLNAIWVWLNGRKGAKWKIMYYPDWTSWQIIAVRSTYSLKSCGFNEILRIYSDHVSIFVPGFANIKWLRI